MTNRRGSAEVDKPPMPTFFIASTLPSLHKISVMNFGLLYMSVPFRFLQQFLSNAPASTRLLMPFLASATKVLMEAFGRADIEKGHRGCCLPPRALRSLHPLASLRRQLSICKHLIHHHVTTTSSNIRGSGIFSRPPNSLVTFIP